MLGFERESSGSHGRRGGTFDDLLGLARAGRRADEPTVRQELARVYSRRTEPGVDPGPDGRRCRCGDGGTVGPRARSRSCMWTREHGRRLRRSRRCSSDQRCRGHRRVGHASPGMTTSSARPAIASRAAPMRSSATSSVSGCLGLPSGAPCRPGHSLREIKNLRSAAVTTLTRRGQFATSRIRVGDVDEAAAERPARMTDERTVLRPHGMDERVSPMNVRAASVSLAWRAAAERFVRMPPDGAM